jgi:hypothetical protein
MQATRRAPMRRHLSRHGHGFTRSKEWLPRSVAERHAGDQGHGLHAWLSRYAVSRRELLHRAARLRQAEQTTELIPVTFRISVFIVNFFLWWVRK